MRTPNSASLLILLLMIYVTSCKSLFGIQTATAIGTAGGEAAGEIIGNASGNASAGASIGANLGEVTGSVIGTKMDKQAAEIKKDISQAKVERTGNGIVVEFNSKILFQSNQADLSSAAEKNLDVLSRILKEYPDTDLEIQGHTDNKGADNINMSLSEKRAKSVQAYLVTSGITKDRLSTKGFGSTSPKYSNDSNKGRMQNRRVDVVISAKKQ